MLCGRNVRLLPVFHLAVHANKGVGPQLVRVQGRRFRICGNQGTGVVGPRSWV